MKIALALLAIIGLSQAYVSPDFYEDNEGLTSLFSINPAPYPARTLLERELLDFFMLIPRNKFRGIVFDYWRRDRQVRHAAGYVRSREFHGLMRDVEALKEYQAIVIYLEKAGLDAIGRIQQFHKAIGMEDYVPPKIENESEGEIGVLKPGEGMRAMFNDLIDALPNERIENLYQSKMKKSSKIFSEFVSKVTSTHFEKMVATLQEQKAFKDFVTKSTEHGLDLQGAENLSKKVVPIFYPQIFK